MAYERTWQFIPMDGPLAAVSAADAIARWLWYLKSILTGQIGGATQGLWTIEGSSDGVNAAMDGVDRWTTTYNAALIPWSIASPATPFGWMVLSRTFTVNSTNHKVWLLMGTQTEFGSTTGRGRMYFSLGNVTGGTTTAMPTSTLPFSSLRLSGGNHTYATDLANNRRRFAAISTLGEFWAAETIASEISYGVLFLQPVGCKSNDQFPFLGNPMMSCDSTAYYFPFHPNSTTTSNMNGTPNGTRNFASTTGWYFWLHGAPGFVSLDPTDVSIFDFPAQVCIGNAATGVTSYHARGRLPDMGLSCANSGAVAQSAGRPTANGTTIRNQAGVIEYVTVGNMILPYNAALS